MPCSPALEELTWARKTRPSMPSTTFSPIETSVAPGASVAVTSWAPFGSTPAVVCRASDQKFICTTLPSFLPQTPVPGPCTPNASFEALR